MHLPYITLCTSHLPALRRIMCTGRPIRCDNVIGNSPSKDRPFGPRVGKYTVRVRGLSNRIPGYGCPPILYLDGINLGSIDDAEYGGPDLLVFPHDIEGVEVYGPATVPAEYGGSDAGCGVIVVWKRRY